MKKIKITTPENIEVEYTLADLGSRVGAAVIDTSIQGLFTIALAVACLIIADRAPDFWEAYYGWIIAVGLLVNFLVSIGYFIVSELNMNGMTPGKKVLKLKTIRRNGQSLTLRHSALRNLFRLFIDVYGIGVVLIFFNKEHKRLGDMVASTIVVVEETKLRPIVYEEIHRIDEQFRYYLNEEEYELLKDYYQRKDALLEYDQVRERLMLYFDKKFEQLGLLEEWKKTSML